MENNDVKLHLGCGDIYLDGWVNIDLDSKKADVHCDLTKPLPYDSGSISMIYNEHFIEHIDVKSGVLFMKECYRVLKLGGILRIATPDLDHLIHKYMFGWKNQDWIKTYGYEWLGTKAEMLNLCFREWGHQYLYNAEELNRRLKESGFAKLKKCKLYKSDHPDFKNIETRKESNLIIEATKS